LLVASPLLATYERTGATLGLLTSLGVLGGAIYFLPDLKWKVTGILSVLCLMTFIALVRSQREIYRLKNELGLKIVAHHRSSSSSQISLEKQPQNKLIVDVDMQFINQSQVPIGIKHFSVSLYKKGLLKSEILPLEGCFQWTRYTDSGNPVIMEDISIKAKDKSDFYRCLVQFSFQESIGQLLLLKPIVRINIETTYLDEPYSVDIYPNWALVQKRQTGSRTITKITQLDL
jgi:hypothetical protein